MENNTDYDADISNWILVSAKKSFSMPRNTTIGPKKKMIISSKITNFSLEDKDTLKLVNSEGEVVFDYSSSVFPPVVRQDLTTTTQPKISTAIQPLLVIPILDKQIPIENLGATAIQSDVVKNNSNNSYLPILGSIIFIGASASVVYFIRQKKVILGEADDFEILDE